MPCNKKRTPEELLKDSIHHLSEACKQSPNEPTYHNNLGLSQFEAEEFEAALSSYNKAI